jgi:phosphoserine phosphatase
MSREYGLEQNRQCIRDAQMADDDSIIGSGGFNHEVQRNDKRTGIKACVYNDKMFSENRCSENSEKIKSGLLRRATHFNMEIFWN